MSTAPEIEEPPGPARRAQKASTIGAVRKALLAEIGDREIEPPLHLTIGVL